MDENGKNLVTNIETTQDILGLKEMLSGHASPYTLITKAPCVLISISNHAFKKLIAELSRYTNRYLSEKLCPAAEFNINSPFQNIEKRLVYFLDLFSTEKYQDIHPTKNCLANLMGTSLRHINRLIVELQRRGGLSQMVWER